MISQKIVDSDAFLEMPQSSQNLYFHLNMRADDDGFVGNPKKIIRMIGASDDDYKILIAKRFIIVFESGVCVIKHWLIHNLIRNDRYNETQYLEEKKQLQVKENKSYTEAWQPNGNQMATQVRIGKVSIDKDNMVADAPAKPKFQKPTVQELTAYIKEKNYNVDASRFFNFYESKGWKVGKNPMVNWKAAVATWNKDEPKTTPSRAVKEFKVEQATFETDEEREATKQKLKAIRNNIFIK